MHGTTPEFDDLAKEVGLTPVGAFGERPFSEPQMGVRQTPLQYGVTEPFARARLRAELDGMIAHLYELTEVEFAHILNSFPLVPEAVKVAARNAWRDVERGLINSNFLLASHEAGQERGSLSTGFILPQIQAAATMACLILRFLGLGMRCD